MLVWLSVDSPSLPAAARDELMDVRNRIVFSLVSLWEASIKFALGRADFSIHPRMLRRSLLEFGFSELPITSEHAIATATLPHVHRDPFDRLLVAQAQVEGLTLMTTDKKLAQYGSFVQRY
jgi:PIN domain nuclease of toxin-antitoxin system